MTIRRSFWRASSPRRRAGLPKSEPSVPPALEALAMRLLVKDPDERTISIADIRQHIQNYVEGIGHDYRRERVSGTVAWTGGALLLFAFLVWYLTGQSIANIVTLGPPAVLNAVGWFLLVVGVGYPLWAQRWALRLSRRELDPFRTPNSEELFVSGYLAHRSFAAALAPLFQLVFIVELTVLAVIQASRGGARSEHRAAIFHANARRVVGGADRDSRLPIRVPVLALERGAIRAPHRSFRASGAPPALGVGMALLLDHRALGHGDDHRRARSNARSTRRARGDLALGRAPDRARKTRRDSEDVRVSGNVPARAHRHDDVRSVLLLRAAGGASRGVARDGRGRDRVTGAVFLALHRSFSRGARRLALRRRDDRHADRDAHSLRGRRASAARENSLHPRPVADRLLGLFRSAAPHQELRRRSSRARPAAHRAHRCARERSNTPPT